MYLSWFNDGNGLPVDCIVIVPQRQQKLEVGIKAPAGWHSVDPDYEKNSVTLNIRIGKCEEEHRDDKLFNLIFNFFNNTQNGSTLVGMCSIPVQLRSHKWNGKFITGNIIPVMPDDSIPVAEVVELPHGSSLQYEHVYEQVIMKAEPYIPDNDTQPVRGEQQAKQEIMQQEIIETLTSWKQKDVEEV